MLRKTSTDRSWGLGIGTRVILDNIERGGVADISGELIAGAEIMYINGQLTRKQPLELAKRLIVMNSSQVVLGVRDPDYRLVSNKPFDAKIISKNGRYGATL